MTVMPCYDKKLEASRPDFFNQEYQTRDVDCVVTTGVGPARWHRPLHASPAWSCPPLSVRRPAALPWVLGHTSQLSRCPGERVALNQAAWGDGWTFLLTTVTLVGHPSFELSSLTEAPECSLLRCPDSGGKASLREHMSLSASGVAVTVLMRVWGPAWPPPATLLGGWMVGCGSGELAGSSEEPQK